MSVMGTGVAAGVAQSGLTSQQVAQQRDKREVERRRQLQELQDRYLGRLDGPEAVESTDADNTAHSQPEGERRPVAPGARHPQHAAPDPAGLPGTSPDRVDLVGDASEPQTGEPGAPHPGGDGSIPGEHAAEPGADAPLYRHLDVRA